eukprot:Phypoly_transcript_20212.p1 GENE.Phypoly_transcript_20212~~Phypoly_transcript_20212.p1  ORF type:complete len:186 (+),score=36.21 Phypoly_transcript_20212:111-668(+)
MAYKDRLDEYFDLFDVKKDGFLDPADYAVIGSQLDIVFGFPSDDPHSASKLFYDFFASFIRELDSNKDGKLSKEEFFEGIEQHFIGRTFDTAPAWWKDRAAGVFKVFDKNKNGELSLDEVKSYVKLMNPKETDENIEHALEWAKKLRSGKFDAETFIEVILIWTTSPGPVPEADTLLPFFRNCEK